MLIRADMPTNYFRLGIVIFATLISFWIIKEAFAKPFTEWETYNEVRSAEIRAIINN